MMGFDVIGVSQATGCESKDVAEALTVFDLSFKKYKIIGTTTIVGILATAATETRFRCIDEVGNNNLWHGRGYGQLTSEINYRKYGTLIGVDLVNHPNLANDPGNAADIMVNFFRETACDIWAQRANWRKVRKIYNGGLNGWDAFQLYVYNLLDLFYKG
jgi:predicted chitinase